jgi:outer membrane receptor protein involved in Fe transport
VKTTDSFDTKFNWQMSQTDQISARLSVLRPALNDPAEFGACGGSKQGSPSGNGFSGIGTDTTYSTGVNYTRTWSSTLVMEARGGLNYFHNEALSGGNGLKTAEEVGIRGANIDDWTSGMTSIDFGTNLSLSSPLVGFSGSLPWDRSERTVQFATVFTKVAGNHTIKFGEDFRHTRDFLLQTQDNGGPRGQFQFRAPQTSIPGDAAATAGFANAFASFLLDVPSLVQRDLKVTDPGVRFWAFFSFLQDKWAVTPKLTIDLGLRHEYYTPLVGLTARGGLSNYDPTNNTLRVSGYTEVPANLGVKSYWKNFNPRTGVSWRLDETNVLRAGYGVSTTPWPDNSYAFNFPVKQNNQINPPNSFGTAGSMAAGLPAPNFADIPTTGVVPGQAFNQQGFFSVPTDLHEGRLHSWNVAYQRQLPGGFTGEVAYVANRGQDIIARIDLNAGYTLGAENAGRPLFAEFGRSASTTTTVPVKSTFHSMQV